MGLEVIVDDSAPRSGQTVTGYGGRIPTRYRLKGTDNRIRRVYAMCYGNSATFFIRANGKDSVLSVEAEHMIEQAKFTWERENGKR